MNRLHVVILAAGQGTRMKSELPKVLHRIAGKAMLRWIVEEAQTLSPEKIIVIHGHKGEQVKECLADLPITWIEQAEQLGTGHAVQQALPALKDADQVLVLLGDTPMISEDSLRELCDNTNVDQLGLLTEFLDDPTGMGRILRDKQRKVTGIVEQKDATIEQLEINEINTGIMLLPMQFLPIWLAALENHNAQNEFYLTDTIAMAAEQQVAIKTSHPLEPEEVMGVNTRRQLAYLERYYQQSVANALLDEGVTLADPERFDLRGELNIEPDVTIDINVIIKGECHIASGCDIGANVILKNVKLAENVKVLPNSVLEDCSIGANSHIGPFARIRPGTETGEAVKIGNFVETKKAKIGRGSKVSHLSYIGDANIGEQVNVGAGTITCNYDGVNKHKTIIEDGAFIGSDTQLIAPVKIGKGAFIGAGSSISKDAPANKLTLSRGKQQTIEHWQLPKKG